MPTNRKTNNNSRKNTRKSDPLTLGRFLEEFAWLLESYDDLDFKALAQIRNQLVHSANTTFENSNLPENVDDVTLNLVGTLPGLLVDPKLFPSNETIADFAATTLGIKIPRWQKKSKYEIIGHIVCNTENANKKDLNRVVKALKKLVGSNKSKRKQIEADVKSGRSWNEVIQSLLAES